MSKRASKTVIGVFVETDSVTGKTVLAVVRACIYLGRENLGMPGFLP